MYPGFIRLAGLAIVVFIGLAAVEVVLLAVAAGSAPNAVSIPLAEQFSLLGLLWHSNPEAALPLIVQTPVFVIAHREPADSLQTWGLYYYPFTFVVHLAIAVVAARQLRRSLDPPRYLPWLASGGAALPFAV